MVQLDSSGAKADAPGNGGGGFTGLKKNDSKGINGSGMYPFTNDCHRIENGAPTTNEPPNKVNGFAMDCVAQFKPG